MKRIIAMLLSALIILSLAGCSPADTADQTATADEIAQDQAAVGVYGHSDFDSDNYIDILNGCVEQIQSKADFVPDIVLVLGSGLGDFADNVDIKATIPYEEIEGFPVSTVAGHDGELVFCEIAGKKVVIMNGRVHYYEGYDMKEVVLPLRVLGLLGAKTVILTNAVGAINADYSVGDFVLNVDHISSFVPSPLIGENIDELGDRFTDMSHVYDSELIDLAQDVADSKDIPVQKGVFLQVTGPQYETPSEIKMFRSLGADTVGMSTAVEAIAAKHMGMRVLSISCVTNMAAGMQEKLSHEEVKEASDSSADQFSALIQGVLAGIPE